MNVVAIIMASQETCSGRAPRETPEWRRPACLVASILVRALEFSWLFSTCLLVAFVFARDCRLPPHSGKTWSDGKGPAALSFGKTNTKEATTNFYNRLDEKSGEEQAEKRKENSRSRIIYLL